MDSQHIRWMLSKQIHVSVYHIGDAPLLMAGEVPIELCTLPDFRSKLQLNELLIGFWASIRSVVV